MKLSHLVLNMQKRNHLIKSNKALILLASKKKAYQKHFPVDLTQFDES